MEASTPARQARRRLGWKSKRGPPSSVGPICREPALARRAKAEAEQTRMKIVEAARHVFLARGVAYSGLEQIARLPV